MVVRRCGVAVIRFALIAALATAACSSAETTPSGPDSPASDAHADVAETARDTAVDEASAETAAADAGHCCPIGERGCCMSFGGSRASNPSCGRVCDSIPTDLEVRIDGAGCPYWYDPPGGGVTCTFEPPDTGSTD